MPELLETIAMGTFGETEEKCPFKEKEGKDVSEETENIEKDDRDSVTVIQANNGGILGENLENGKHSSDAGTFNDIPRKAPPYKEKDIWRRKTVLTIPFTQALTDQYGPAGYMMPYHSSAHHVIPGNAALYSSDLYKKYMVKGGKAEVMVEGEPKTWEIEYNIGYNVNGSHNGVWLPNNFGIQKIGTPTGTKWSAYTKSKVGSKKRKWIVAYMATATKWKGRQFHDTHATYNKKVKGLMNKIAEGLVAHQTVCGECAQKAEKKIPPPYKVKLRLYAISRVLRSYLQGSPVSWKAPFLASDQFRRIKKNSSEWEWFKEVYNAAETEPQA